MVIDAKTKDVVWAYEVHKSSYGSLVLGTLAARARWKNYQRQKL